MLGDAIASKKSKCENEHKKVWALGNAAGLPGHRLVFYPRTEFSVLKGRLSGSLHYSESRDPLHLSVQGLNCRHSLTDSPHLYWQCLLIYTLLPTLALHLDFIFSVDFLLFIICNQLFTCFYEINI